MPWAFILSLRERFLEIASGLYSGLIGIFYMCDNIDKYLSISLFDLSQSYYSQEKKY